MAQNQAIPEGASHRYEALAGFVQAVVERGTLRPGASIDFSPLRRG